MTAAPGFPVTGLYAGLPSTLPSGERSAMLKRPLLHARITRSGLVGDAQADRRHHGGPDKALHQYASVNYARLIAAFPALADNAVPGSLGENFSCPALDEHSVCVGDRWQLGTAIVEITQPRSPCTKIDARHATPGLARFVHEQHLPGWYLRVLEEGEVALGDRYTLLMRPNPEVTLARFLAVVAAHRPQPAALESLLACSGLAADWRQRLSARLAFQQTLRDEA